VNLADFDRALKQAGHPGAEWWSRTTFHGGTMTQLNERDEPRVTRFASEDAMFRSLFADAAMDLPPRAGALLHPSAIQHLPSRALWRVALPAHSMMKDRANGLLAMMDTSGLVADPEHGALQITILDAATGAVRASWIPPHAVTWLRFDGENVVVDDQRENASICDPLTGRVLGATEPGMRASRAEQVEPTLPFPLEAGQRIATVTPDTVWVDAGEELRILERATGRVLSKQPVPWGEDKLYGLENGYSPADGLVLVSSEEDLSAYSA